MSANILQEWDQVQADPDFQKLSGPEREYVGRGWLADRKPMLDALPQSARQHVISRVRGIPLPDAGPVVDRSAQQDAPYAPIAQPGGPGGRAFAPPPAGGYPARTDGTVVEAAGRFAKAFGRGFGDESINETIQGHASRAGARLAGEDALKRAEKQGVMSAEDARWNTGLADTSGKTYDSYDGAFGLENLLHPVNLVQSLTEPEMLGRTAAQFSSADNFLPALRGAGHVAEPAIPAARQAAADAIKAGGNPLIEGTKAAAKAAFTNPEAKGIFGKYLTSPFAQGVPVNAAATAADAALQSFAETGRVDPAAVAQAAVFGGVLGGAIEGGMPAAAAVPAGRVNRDLGADASRMLGRARPADPTAPVAPVAPADPGADIARVLQATDKGTARTQAALDAAIRNGDLAGVARAEEAHRQALARSGQAELGALDETGKTPLIHVAPNPLQVPGPAVPIPGALPTGLLGRKGPGVAGTTPVMPQGFRTTDTRPAHVQEADLVDQLRDVTDRMRAAHERGDHDLTQALTAQANALIQRIKDGPKAPTPAAPTDPRFAVLSEAADLDAKTKAVQAATAKVADQFGIKRLEPMAPPAPRKPAPAPRSEAPATAPEARPRPFAQALDRAEDPALVDQYRGQQPDSIVNMARTGRIPTDTSAAEVNPRLQEMAATVRKEPSALGRFEAVPQPMRIRSEPKHADVLTPDEALHRTMLSKNHQHHLAKLDAEGRQRFMDEFKQRWVGEQPYHLATVDLEKLDRRPFNVDEKKVAALMKEPPKDDGNHPIISRNPSKSDHDHLILDGNHRVEAALRNGDKEMKAYVARDVLPDLAPGAKVKEPAAPAAPHPKEETAPIGAITQAPPADAGQRASAAHAKIAKTVADLEARLAKMKGGTKEPAVRAKLAQAKEMLAAAEAQLERRELKPPVSASKAERDARLEKAAADREARRKARADEDARAQAERERDLTPTAGPKHAVGDTVLVRHPQRGLVKATIDEMGYDPTTRGYSYTFYGNGKHKELPNGGQFREEQLTPLFKGEVAPTPKADAEKSPAELRAELDQVKAAREERRREREAQAAPPQQEARVPQAEVKDAPAGMQDRLAAIADQKIADGTAALADFFKDTRLSANPFSPEVMKALADIGAGYALRGVVKFAEWAKAMRDHLRREFGPRAVEAVEPHLDDLYDTALGEREATIERLLADHQDKQATPAPAGGKMEGQKPGETTDGVDVLRPGAPEAPTSARPDVPGRAEGGRAAEAGRAPGEGGGPGKRDRGGDGVERGPLVRDPGPRERDPVPAAEKLKPKDVVSPAGTTPKPGSAPTATNYRIPDDVDPAAGGKKTKFRANVDAIKLVKQLEDEGRLPTPDEQATLAKYVGWGGVFEVFNPYRATGERWDAESRELRALLTPAEWKSASDSSDAAHYTAKAVIQGIYDGLVKAGFKGGRMLEPGMGTGNFFGWMPGAVADHPRTSLVGVELDGLTGRIAQLLYPEASIHIKSYEDVLKGTDLDGYFDLAIGNVPFSSAIHPADAVHNRDRKLNLHDWYFVKSLAKVREGGLVAFITATGTLDKPDATVRARLAKDADLVAAVRIPNDAFEKNAHTSVTTDLVILRKRLPGEKPGDLSWVKTGTREVEGVARPLNGYYLKHPDAMLGELAVSTMYGPKESASLALKGDGRDLRQAIGEALAKALPKDAFKKAVHKATEQVPVEALAPPGTQLKANALTVHEGKLVRHVGGRLVEAEIPRVKDAEAKAKVLVAIRDAARDVLHTQMAGLPDADLAAARARLGKLYDAFVKKFGPITGADNHRVMQGDPDHALVVSLEKIDPKTKAVSKADLFTKRTIQPQQAITRVEDAKHGLVTVLARTGRVDLGQIAALAGKTEQAVIDELGALVYEHPSGGWQTADEYLSGNVRQKLREARVAAEGDPRFARNVAALEAAQPEDVPFEAIKLKLGASWTPPAVVAAFVQKLTGAHGREVSATYSPAGAFWDVKLTGYARTSVANTRDFFVQSQEHGAGYGKDLEDLLNDMLNFKETKIYYTVDDKRVLDAKATEVANETREKIQKAYDTWLADPSNDKLRGQLAAIYNEQFNTNRNREFDGSHLTFPGMAAHIQLNPHQANAAWRIIQERRALLAHSVGAGKTFAMSAAAMELRRLGIAKKPMFAVPNHLIEQFPREFRALYPAANVLAVTEKDLTAANRQALMARIATGDWDAVFIPHSQLLKIPNNPEAELAILQGEMDDLEASHHAMTAELGEQEAKGNRVVKQIAKSRKALASRLKDLQEKIAKRQDRGVSFDELGVDYLFVDEAHNFKNLRYATKRANVAGMGQPLGVEKTFDMLAKVRHIQSLSGGRGVVFATGTPVTNSMAEMYHMLKYLMPEELERMGIKHFDAWASNFGQTVTQLEPDLSGQSYKAKTRFSKFFNLPELATLFRSVADVQTAEMLNLAVPKAEMINVYADPSENLMAYTQGLLQRAQAIKGGKPTKGSDNMLSLTGLGRSASLSMRLIDDRFPDEPSSKINLAVANVVKEYHAGTGVTLDGPDGKPHKANLTQMIFLDTRSPEGAAKRAKAAAKAEEAARASEDAEGGSADEPEADDPGNASGAREVDFRDGDSTYSPYHDIKEKLIAQGIPADEIAFIHDAKNDKQKAALLDQVREGQVRVLLGSTPKMGEGTNVQRYLGALHHLDATHTPAGMEQRNGRIVRQGNLNKDVRIYTYATKKSFDANMFLVLGVKQNFINQILRGEKTLREGDDMFSGAMDYAEMSAAASDNPLEKERINLEKRLNTLTGLEATHSDKIKRIQADVRYAEIDIAKAKESLALVVKDRDRLRAHRGDGFAMTVAGKTFDEREAAGAALNAVIAKLKPGDAKEVGTFAGFPLRVERSGEAITRQRATTDEQGKLQLETETIHPTVAYARGAADHPFNPSDSAAGTVQSIEAALRKIDHDDVADLPDGKKLARATQRKAELEAVLKQPFEQADELAEKRARLAEIEKIREKMAADALEAQKAAGMENAPPGGFTEADRVPSGARRGSVTLPDANTIVAKAREFLHNEDGFWDPNDMAKAIRERLGRKPADAAPTPSTATPRPGSARTLTSEVEVKKALPALERKIAALKGRLEDPNTSLDPALAAKVRDKLAELRAEAEAMHQNASLTRGQATDVAGRVAPEIHQPGPRPAGEAPTVGPAPAYNGAKHEGNLNLDRILDLADPDADAIKGVLQTIYAETRSQVDAARGGTVTHAETQRLADEMSRLSDYTAQDLLKHNQGDPLDHVRLTVARDLLTSSAEGIHALATAIREAGTNVTNAQRLEFVRRVELHAKMNAVLAGIKAEVGRSLSAMRIQSRAKANQVREINHLIQDLGGESAIDKLADAIATMDTPEAVTAAANKLVKKGFRHMAAEYYVMSLVSGIPTHARNILGNSFNGAAWLAEDAAAAGVRALKGGDGMTMRQVAAEWQGLSTGMGIAWAAAQHTFKTGESGSGISQMDAHPGAIPGKVGEVVRLPGRFLGAEDEFFKVLFHRMSLYGQAVEIALAAKHQTPEETTAHIDRLIEEPTPEMFDEAVKEAHYRALQQPSGLIMSALTRAKAAVPEIGYIIPFVKTPGNLAKYAAERTPLAYVAGKAGWSQKVKAELEAGGVRQDRMEGKIIVGSALMGMALVMAAQGALTGAGPSDPDDRKTLEATGWRPYSMVFSKRFTPNGKTWYIPFNQATGSFGMLAGIAADVIEGKRSKKSNPVDALVNGILMTVSGNIANQTFLRGVSDAMRATSDPDRYLQDMVANIVGGHVPTFVSNLAGAVDPVLRDTKGESLAEASLNKIESRLPGLSTRLPAQTDPTGQPKTRDLPGPLVPLSPVAISTGRDDRLLSELARLDENPSHVSSKLEHNGWSVDLTLDQRRELGALRGQMLDKLLRPIVEKPGWTALSEERQKAAIDKVRSRATAAAKARFMKEHADTIRAALKAQRK